MILRVKKTNARKRIHLSSAISSRPFFSFDDKYDYRYSRLIFVYGRLLKEGWLNINELEGLDDDKMTKIKYVAESLKSKI
ncbi:MAG: hypothetical protein JXB23_11195 [Candidatus Aminicenantes bacterium]|nr:hypothetical protein [Candidatus Aminicenantes bacterium]